MNKRTYARTDLNEQCLTVSGIAVKRVRGGSHTCPAPVMVCDSRREDIQVGDQVFAVNGEDVDLMTNANILRQLSTPHAAIETSKTGKF